jgi:2Fe-2S ferredoxin
MDGEMPRGEVDLRIGSAPPMRARLGERLIDVCEKHDGKIPFSCRAASCGTCAVRVLDGMANLSRMDDRERIVIEDLEQGGPNVRLACQVRVFGPAHVELVTPDN